MKKSSEQVLQALWMRLLDREPTTRPLWMRWGFALAITGISLWARMLIGPPESGMRFATLTLAVVLAALFGGISSGLLSTAVGTVLASYFFIEPYGKPGWTNTSEALWLIGTFLVTMLVVLAAIWVMQFRNRRLHDLTRKLTESQGKLHNTFEHAAAGITHVGLEGQLLEANQTFCDLVGYTLEELQTKTFQDITEPEDLPIDLALLNESLAGKRANYALEKRYLCKDGKRVWVKLTVALVRDEQGAPDYFISVVQDISALKAAEEALRTSERVMQQAQAVAGFITWESDIATQQFRAIGKARRWLGLPSGSFGAAEILDRVHPDEHGRLLTEWGQAIKGTSSFVGQYRGQSSKNVDWFMVQAHFERDASGKAVRAYGITQDISHRKLAELEIQRLNASLEQGIQERTKELKSAYTELESYSYAVAHDLRSPLRIINGFAQALEEDHPEFDDASLIHIHRIKSSSRKMGQLIDGLLHLSQVSRGEVNRQPINLSVIASHLLSDLGREQPDRKVEWSVEPNLHTQADPALVEALLQNLLHNAWKYTEQTPVAQIRVDREVIDGETHFCVSDNGAGFDMGRVEKLFQPFQRLHLPQEYEGLGIGLATAHRIVQRHGGHMRAEGAIGQGARFCFTLPNTAH